MKLHAENTLRFARNDEWYFFYDFQTLWCEVLSDQGFLASMVWFDYRWIKFEEDVEEGGNRWSKPHVATLSLHSLFELRSMILNGTICLDMAATTLDDICELALDNMINANVLTFDKKAFVKDAILKKHHHQYEGSPKDKKDGATLSKLPLIRSLAEIGRNHSSSKSKTTFLLSIHCIQC